MTNKDFLTELKAKQSEGNFKPSDFKRNRSQSLPTTSNKSENTELATIQQELRILQEKLNKLSAENICLKNQKEALELALFEKRLENLKEFGQYHEKTKLLESTELTELTNLKKKLAKNTFNLVLDTNTKLVLSLLTLALFINLLTK
jgi:hypothetical protein